MSCSRCGAPLAVSGNAICAACGASPAGSPEGMTVSVSGAPAPSALPRPFGNIRTGAVAARTRDADQATRLAGSGSGSDPSITDADPAIPGLPSGEGETSYSSGDHAAAAGSGAAADPVGTGVDQ